MAKPIKNIPANIQPEPALLAQSSGLPPTPGNMKFSIAAFRVQAFIIAWLCIIFYANTFNHEAAFDDRMAITDNEYVQAGLAGIPDILTKDAYQSYLEHRQGSNQLAGGRYRPLSLITFSIEQQVMGTAHDNETSAEKEARIAAEMHPRHVVNVLLYIIACITLLYFLRTIVFTGNPVIAFVAALLFTIHPIHTEVVANVKSRDEILSVLFISLTFINAVRYYDTRKIKDLMWALICFFLALLSKEYAFILTVLVPLSFYLFRNETWNKSVRAFLPCGIPLALYFALRFVSVSAAAEGAETNIMNNPYLLATGAQKIASEILVLLHYLRLLVFPNPLAADYSYNQLPYTSFANPLVWLSLATYLALTGALIWLLLKKHVLTFAIALYFLPLFLVSNLLFNIGAPMGERLIFHSSIGFAIAVAWLLVKGLEKVNAASASKAGLIGITCTIIILCGYKTIDRNNDWKNDETLFLHDVKTVPNSVLVNNNAAASCMSNAKINKADIPLRNEWFTKAIGYFDKAISIYPGHMMAHLNRGVCYFNMGFPDMALPNWDTVRKYQPSQPELARYMASAAGYYYNKGVNFGKNNLPDSAIYAYKKLTEINPEKAEAWYFLASAYFTSGRFSEAEAYIAKSLSIAPGYADAQKLKSELAVRLSR